MEALTFLSVADVIAIHTDTIAHEGGLDGIRNRGLLEAAIALPRQQFGGNYLHETVHDMAAAYLFHLSQNHPFHDGNKRAAFLSATLFLRENGFSLDAAQTQATEMALAVAKGELDKPAIAKFYRDHTVPLS